MQLREVRVRQRLRAAAALAGPSRVLMLPASCGHDLAGSGGCLEAGGQHAQSVVARGWAGPNAVVRTLRCLTSASCSRR